MIIYYRYRPPYLSPCPGFDLSLPFLPRSISSSTAWGWPWSTPSRSRWGTSPPPRLYLGQPVITERRGSFSDGPTLFLVVSEQCLQGTRGHLHRLQSVHPCWPVTTILKKEELLLRFFYDWAVATTKYSQKVQYGRGWLNWSSWWSSYHFNITFCFTISKLVTLATFPHVWLLLNKEIFKRQISIKYEKFWPKGPTFCPFSSFFCTLTLFSFNIQQGRSTSRCIYVFFWTN